MCRFALAAVVLVLASYGGAIAQQLYRLPDVSGMKHMTTSQTDRSREIPGKETTMDYYAGSGGQIVTIYSFRGRKVAFSTHNNSDIQSTYRIFLDMTGGGTFQEIDRSVPWQLPAWAR
jgi:hypothetical protein